MTPEDRNIPDWAQRERQADFGWIQENLDVFWTVATTALEDAGRGAIVVDTTLEPVPGAGKPFAYFSQDQVEERGDEDTQRMVAKYDPAQEFVVVLLKSHNHSSTYRVGIVPPESREAVAGEGRPSHTAEPAAEPRLEPPDIETLIALEAEGGCEAACPHHCWVEADGRCTHGNPSWLLRLGWI
jgi:hypothetical protein